MGVNGRGRFDKKNYYPGPDGSASSRPYFTAVENCENSSLHAEIKLGGVAGMSPRTQTEGQGGFCISPQKGSIQDFESTRE